MLIYSLDEFGHFEKSEEEKNGPEYIAGVIYDDKDIDGEADKERKRIEAYYCKIMSSCKTNNLKLQYPSSLHVNSRYYNNNEVKTVKEKVSTTIAEFLKLGTWSGKELLPAAPRKGEYHVFVILKSGMGMTNLFDSEASEFVRDDFASNLYFHMARQFVSRVVFHNPKIDIHNQSLTFNLATRASSNLDENSEESRQFEKMGYEKRGGSTSVYYKISDPNIYRTLIADEMLDSEMYNVNVKSFDVTSINYNNPANMEFLYLADSICSYLGFHIFGNNEEQWCTNIDSRLKEITHNPQLFAYDEIDTIFEYARKAYAHNDYFRAFSRMYDCSLKTGNFARYYNSTWVEMLKNKMLSAHNSSAIKAAVEKLDDYLRTNNADTGRCRYIFKALESCVSAYDAEKLYANEKYMLYTFYDVGITVCTHLGDSNQAEAYYRELKKYSDYAGNEQFLSTQNRLIVFMCDSFRYQEALLVAGDNIEKQEYLAKIRNKTVYNRSLGKALSQRGQVLAFMRDSRAETDFIRALKYMQPDSPDYKITQSYLLHYYADNHIKDRYLSEVAAYLGGNTAIADQLRYIREESVSEDAVISMDYAFLVLVRGIYQFRRDEMLDEDWKNICEAEKSKKFHNHPAELIYKYLALLALSKKDYPSADRFERNISRCLSGPGNTAVIVQKYSACEVAGKKGKNIRGDLETIRKMMPEEKAPNCDSLKNILTFMYR